MPKSRIPLALFSIAFVDMMGFSLQFPLFPKTIQYFMAKGSDPVFDLLFQFSLFLGDGKESEYSFILLGGILGSLYSLLQFVFSPIWGKLSDSRGRRSILLITTFGSVIGYLVWFFSSHFWIFVLSRMLTGIMGGNISVAQAAMSDHTSLQDRAKGMGMIGAGIGLGFVLGPVLGGVTASIPILDFLTEQGVLVIFPMAALFSLIFSLLNLAMVYFFLPKNPEPALKPLQFKKGKHPILGFFSTKGKVLKELCLLNLVFSIAFSGFEFTLNFFLAGEFAYSPKEIGFTFLYIGLVIILIQGGLVRRLSGKISEKKIALLGGYALILGFLSLILIRTPSSLYFSLLLLAAGSALVNPGLSSFASVISSSEEQGSSLGLFRSFSSLARGISPLLFAMIYFKDGVLFSFIVSTVLIYLFVYRLQKIKQESPIENTPI